MPAGLYPSGGMTCFAGDASFAHCPVTARLRAALMGALAQSGGGGGADPVCGCQNVDSNISFSFDVSPPGGIVHASMFNGSLRLDYVVVLDSGTAHVDDLLYCTAPHPHSIYPNEGATC